MSQKTPLIFLGLLSVICVQQAFYNFSIVTHLVSLDVVNYAYGRFESSETPLTTVESDFKSEKSFVYFVGDIMLGRDVERRLLSNGSDYPYQKISFDKSSDHVVGNFEASIPVVHVPTRDNTFKFSVNKKFLGSLSDSGFTHVSLANNHSFDYGLDGYKNSFSELLNHGITPFGHPSKVSTSSVTFLKAEQKTLAVVAIHTLFLAPDLDEVTPILEYAKFNSDILVVYIHWGDEYSLLPSSAQKTLAAYFAEQEVDVVIGHHPHVVQSIERVEDTLVFYSLGNYIFDQYFSEDVQVGLMLKFSFAENDAIELIPVSSLTTRVQPGVMEAAEKADFLESLSNRSEEELRTEIAAGQVFMSKKLASSTELVIMAK